MKKKIQKLIMSENRTTSEIRTILQPDRNEKCRNPDVRISDTHCTHRKLMQQKYTARIQKPELENWTKSLYRPIEKLDHVIKTDLN